jgi:cysteinyl-tRNA synthetase
LKMGTSKMAGSVGNVVNIADLLQRHSAETVRFLLLSTHYRSPIEYSEDRLFQTAQALQSFYRLFERFQRDTGEDFFQLKAEKLDEAQLVTKLHALSSLVPTLRRQFFACMDDDFNTGGAIGVLFELVNALNRYGDQARLETEQRMPESVVAFRTGMLVIRELSDILGLFWQAPAKAEAGDDKLVGGLMQLLIDIRNSLRAEAKKIAAKDDPVKKALFDQTDTIRKRLAELGVTLEDRPGGTGWRVG